MLVEKRFEDEKGDSIEDLTTCSICLSMIDKPKALPCLHTFCFKCLSEWAKSASKTVTCPVCRKKFTLPPGGVLGLENNFFVTKLKDRKIISKKLARKDCKIPCTSCEGFDRAAVARCFECDDFLCRNCLKSHKSVRSLKSHHTFTLDQLRSGKADPVAKAEYCNKHKGQELWIYCETCNQLICRDCTVFDHCKPVHKFIDLRSAAKRQKEDIENLAEECKKFARSVDSAIESGNKAVMKLEASVKHAVDDLTQSHKQVKASVIKQMETNCKTLTAQIRTEGAKGRKDIESHVEELKILRSRLRTSLETASQLIKTGSDSDVAQMYMSVTKSLKELRSIKQLPVQENRMEGVTFIPNSEEHKQVLSFGSVSADIKGKLTARPWKYQRQIRTPRLSRISDIALINDNVETMCVVHQFQQAFVVKNGTYTKIPKRDSPYGITCNPSGVFCVTGFRAQVFKFSASCTEKGAFSIASPQDTSGYYKAAAITMAKTRNTLVVGDSPNKRICIHTQDGTQLKSFKVPVHPLCISANTNDLLAVSCSVACCTSVVVVDLKRSGKFLFTINAPPSVKEWKPKSVCWNKSDDLFVVNAAEEKGIHQFSSFGEYKGCVVTGLKSPTCLTTSRHDTMLVADERCIKVYNPV